MKFPARRLGLLSLLVSPLALGLGGCVNQDAYDQLRTANDSLKAQNQELLDRNAGLDESNKTLSARAGTADMSREQMAKMINDLQAQVDAANAKFSNFDNRFNDIQLGTLLDPQTDAALKDLAARFPQLLSYDSERGMVRFNSDITFASGSFELTAQAQSALGEFARLLRDIPSAQQYDLKVVGHTDSQSVTQRAGRPFKNNDELSAFRAISVKRELVGNGFASPRVEFAGFGESRPAMPNSASGNTPANRRVEVYLVKSTWDGSAAPTPVAASQPPSRPVQPARPRAVDIMK